MLAVAMTLTGCTTKALPPADRPEIIWPDGEPEGPFEDNPWVQAVRESDAELMIAQVTRDFSSEKLGESSTGSLIHSRLNNIRERAEDEKRAFPLGPTPMIPMYVEDHATGATVYACTAQSFSVTAEDPGPGEPLLGWIEIFELVQEGGRRKVDYSGIGTVEGAEYELGEDVVAPFLDDREDSDCNLDDAKIGLFDPQPDVTVEYAPEDIKTTIEE
jgi:hypothetical protein